MGEVHRYLETDGSRTAARADNMAAPDFLMQSSFLGRLADASGRLGQVEPNSKLGAPGVFLKRAIAKLIGWYSRPVYEFDRAALENFQQIRQDMLRLQQQITGLRERTEEVTRIAAADADAALQAERVSLVASLCESFRRLLASPSIRKALDDSDPALVRRAETLLATAEREFNTEAAVPCNRPRT